MGKRWIKVNEWTPFCLPDSILNICGNRGKVEMLSCVPEMWYITLVSHRHKCWKYNTNPFSVYNFYGVLRISALELFCNDTRRILWTFLSVSINARNHFAQMKHTDDICRWIKNKKCTEENCIKNICKCIL